MTTGSLPLLGPRLRAILRRRSYRSFRPDAPPADAVRALRAAATTAPSVGGRRSGRVVVLDDPDVVGRLPRAVMGGLVGKINPWLLKSHPPLFLLAVGDSAAGLRDGDRHWYNVDAALAGQLVVLEAAGRGLGSCWVAGFHERSVTAVAGLRDGERPLAVIPVGYPAVGPDSGGSWVGRAWDAAAQRLVSARRKPLERLAYRGRFGVPFMPHEVPWAERGVGQGDETPWPGLGPLRPTPAFDGRPVTEPQLAVLLECARWAPSAENSQIARHVVLEGREAVAALTAAAFPGTALEREALPPLALACLAAPFPVTARTREQPFFLIDVPIAVANLLVAAAELGLGWQVAFRFDHRAVAAHLGVPDDHRVVALVGLGTPVDGPHDGPPPAPSQLHPPE
ncbi:MAG: nitroreductase family protein [Deltaproteobacteria bacterium]|nr:nitroreductase family protein [Deltaproteobacteria bacterium]